MFGRIWGEVDAYKTTINMATKEEVERFLSRMKEKINVFGIIYRDDRGKNIQTLVELEITPKFRDSVILHLGVEDYSEGPIIERSTSMAKCGCSVKM